MQGKELKISTVRRLCSVLNHFRVSLAATTFIVLLACLLAMLVNKYSLINATMGNIIKVISWIPWGGAYVSNSYQTWSEHAFEEKWFNRFYIALMFLAIFLGVFESQLQL